MLHLHLIRPARTLASMLCALALLASCGGGVDSGGTGSAFASGSIGGFGSIIVGDVRFDDAAALIEDDDGMALGRDELRLGMVVRVDGSTYAAPNGDKLGVAASIRVASSIIGEIEAFDPAAKTLGVLGQTIQMTPATVFGGLPRGNNDLALGTVVEVHGQRNPVNGRFLATRIEARSNAAFYKLRGPVSGFDTAARTLVIGGQTIRYAQIAPADLPLLAIGALLRAKMLTTPDAGGAWIATELASGAFTLPDRQDAQLEGRIFAWTSSRQFSIDGIQVDASDAIFDGSEAGVVLGARVEVEGSSDGGVLRARLVKVQGEELPGNSSFELHGPVETLDSAARSFVLHGVTVDYNATAVLFEGGTEGDLAEGRKVLVIGIPSPDGTQIQAGTIRFEDQ